MERRQLILGSMATLAASASVGRLSSVIGSDTAFAVPGKTANIDKIISSATKCIETGLSCLTLCRKELAKGDKEMAECLRTVTDMLATSEAVQKLAANESPHLVAMAKICEKICQDCAKSCERHAKHMAECKACMDACKELEKVCAAA